ncbi:MAG: hypothetical protein AAFO99_12210 [Bacteroidota bacterium]
MALLLALLNVRAQENPSPVLDIQSYFDQTRTYKNENKINLALESLNKAAELAERNEDEKALIYSYHQFALSYFSILR